MPLWALVGPRYRAESSRLRHWESGAYAIGTTRLRVCSELSTSVATLKRTPSPTLSSAERERRRTAGEQMANDSQHSSGADMFGSVHVCSD
ncbi:hypothetical protein KOW79_021444 [Hemibagrus wyckioides]|uniref:Uncharacterized protein n=1 Tax=Hemibagrus wyckioides TaxID=337641 RepID=A0A9D3N2I5_9TELE|nr:hypothetical protein KOW79_021444 [Hemibagrus wyckioides]